MDNNLAEKRVSIKTAQGYPLKLSFLLVKGKQNTVDCLYGWKMNGKEHDGRRTFGKLGSSEVVGHIVEWMEQIEKQIGSRIPNIEEWYDGEKRSLLENIL